jgi:Ca2+-binding RTX toxin-like protein
MTTFIGGNSRSIFQAGAAGGDFRLSSGDTAIGFDSVKDIFRLTTTAPAGLTESEKVAYLEANRVMLSNVGVEDEIFVDGIRFNGNTITANLSNIFDPHPNGDLPARVALLTGSSSFSTSYPTVDFVPGGSRPTHGDYNFVPGRYRDVGYYQSRALELTTGGVLETSDAGLITFIDRAFTGGSSYVAGDGFHLEPLAGSDHLLVVVIRDFSNGDAGVSFFKDNIANSTLLPLDSQNGPLENDGFVSFYSPYSEQVEIPLEFDFDGVVDGYASVGPVMISPESAGYSRGQKPFDGQIVNWRDYVTGGEPSFPPIIIPGGDTPVAIADFAMTTESDAFTLAVLVNDATPIGTPLAVTHIEGQVVSVGVVLTLASGAIVTLNADGTITYDPNGAFNNLVSPVKAGATGAANSSANDNFTYTITGGATAGVSVKVDGVDSSDDRLQGAASDDTLTGTLLGDLFMLHEGGEDSVAAGAGDDGFYMGAALSSGDALVGGDGSDQVGLQGYYGARGTSWVFEANNFTSIETLVLLPGDDTRFGDLSNNSYSYFLKTVDGNVASGAQMTVSFNRLRVGENVDFDGSAETDGSFLTFGGLGNDTLIGGQQNDGFLFGIGRWGAGDSVDGHGGSLDQLALQGNYTGTSAITLAADQIANIEMIVLLSGPSGEPYGNDVTMNDANVANGATMYISANSLTSAESVTFNGAAESDGRFVIYGGAGQDALTGGLGNDEISGGAGNDTIVGGLGADTLQGGAGEDTFAYLFAEDSTATSMDRILDFTFGDTIDLTAIDADGNSGNGNTAFTHIGDAAFSGVAGQLRTSQDGGVWRVEGDVDGDGFADLIIAVTPHGGHELVSADFWL